MSRAIRLDASFLGRLTENVAKKRSNAKEGAMFATPTPPRRTAPRTARSIGPVVATHVQRPSRYRRREWILAIGIGTALFLTPARAAEEGVVTYIDISANPNLSPKESTAVLNNIKIQTQNQVPLDFPTFVREGFDIKIIADGYTLDASGLIFKDVVKGEGDYPQDNEQVTFDYTGYNENGSRIDSTYRRGTPAEVRLGTGALIPGFELAIKGMKPGGKRRVIIPPALGPPVGPSTFFSAKQCEVFDVELRSKSSCRQEEFGMFSRIVCQ